MSGLLVQLTKMANTEEQPMQWCDGANAMLDLLWPVIEAAEESIDWLCDHAGALPKPGERKWCGNCHNWIYPKDVGFRARVIDALFTLRREVGG